MLAVLLIFTQFSLADSLFEHGYYEAARVEYKRTFFFYPELMNNPGVRLRLAIAQLKIDEIKGIEEINNIINDFPDLHQDVKIEIAKQFINVGRYYLARDLLSQTDEQRLFGLTYLLDDELKKARDVFVKNGDYALANEINEYIHKPKKSLGTAALLSLVCPGAGEIYAGNIRLGIMDFILNFGSGFLFYNAIRQRKYIDATLIFYFLINRFYLGSIYNAQKSVMERNEEFKEKWLNSIKARYFNYLLIDN